MSELIELKEKAIPENCFVFKHSPVCPISARAEAEVKKAELTMPVYCVNVIDKREVSNWIAETYGIKHESPQVLCIREGEVLRVWNHFEVKKGELEAV